MRGIFCLVVLFALPCAVFANEEFSAEDDFRAQIQHLSSFSASFTQTTTEEDGFLLDEQEGKLYFSRPNYLRWETEAPFAQTLVADGQTIYLYDPDLNQVTIREWSQDPSQNPAAIFVGGDDLFTHFYVALDEEVFVLYPRMDNSTLVRVRLSFDGNSPARMDIEDTLGQTTSIEFREQEIGVPLEPSIFVFSIPEGAEVISDG